MKLTQLRDNLQKYGDVFEDKTLSNIHWNGRDTYAHVTERDLDKYLSLFEKLKVAIAEIAKESGGTLRTFVMG